MSGALGDLHAPGSARRLLILCYFFPPLAGGGVHRVLSFVRELPKQGWNCTVICAGRGDYWVTDETLEARVPVGTEVIRVEGGSALSAWLKLRGSDRGRRSGATFSRLRSLSDWWLMPDSYAGWAKRAASVARRRLKRGDVDCMLSSSPPDSVHLAASSARRGFAVPWVADFRDPWIGLHLRTPPTAWHRGRQEDLEARVLDGADRILAASRTHADRIAKSSPARAGRVVHLPNGFEPDAGEAPPAAGDPSPTFELVFTGTLSQMPEIEVLLEALHELLARRPELRRRVRARFAGPYDRGYEDRAVALGLIGIVEFSGPQSHATSRTLQRRADLLLLWKPRGMPTMVPGKLYEYLASGRPIVAMLPAGEEASDLAERGGASRLDPGDRKALAAEIERHVDRWLAGGREPDRAVPWIEAHTRGALAARLARELDGVVDAHRERRKATA
jgi:glycosyltransferase involved in cell wall biosynthesis